MADDDATTFDSVVDPQDSPAVADRRAKTWQQRERMAWVALIGLIVTMAAALYAFGTQQTTQAQSIIETGEWALTAVVLTFVGGKSLVEAVLSVRGIKA